jgi:hypothetical protein
MRYSRFLVLSVAGLCMPFQLAQAEDPNIVFVSDKEIVLSPFDKELDRGENKYKRAADAPKNCCGSVVYSLLYSGTAENSPTVPDIEEVFVDKDDTETLHIVLSEPISLKRNCTEREKVELEKEGGPCVYDLSDFKIFLRRIVMGPKKDVQGFEISIAPTVTDDFGTRGSIIYRGTHRTPTPVSLDSIKVKVTDKATKAAIPTKAVAIESASKTIPPDGQANWRISLSPPLARGRILAVAVSGIDKYDSSEVPAQGQISVNPYPKGRDDAVFYLRGEKVFSRFGEDQGSVDFKLNQTFGNNLNGSEWWYLLSATVGSDSLDLSQTITASIGKRRWITPAWNYSVAPTYTIDSESKDRDLGLDVMLEGQPDFWYRTIEQKKKVAAKPSEVHSGWWLKPKFALEGGKQLASQSEEVQGKTYSRGLVSLNLLLEREKLFQLFDKVSLTVDAAARYLAQDEVTIDEMKVVKTSSGFMPYLRAELAYDLGPLAFSIVHENGKLPPNFKRAHATTLGVTVKF